jgi:hypothetical protein
MEVRKYNVLPEVQLHVHVRVQYVRKYSFFEDRLLTRVRKYCTFVRKYESTFADTVDMYEGTFVCTFTRR